MNRVKSLVESADKILVIQPENPDGDSVASSLALESILGDIGKEVILYCPVDIPKYLRYLEGWDRITSQLPKKDSDFDIAIIVDTNTKTLLERVLTPRFVKILEQKPVIAIDHHTSEVNFDFETINLFYEDAASTGQIIYELSLSAGWDISPIAGTYIAASILSDTLGLTSTKTTARTIHILAELVDLGVDLNKLDNQRRELNKKSEPIFRYKGRLFERTNFTEDKEVGWVHIPWEDIQEYSDEYNPSMLIIDEIRLVENVKIACAFKTYPDGKITAKIRANPEALVADKIAEHFGGGGHPFASGFKVYDSGLDQVVREFIQVAKKYITEYKDLNEDL